VFLVKTGKKNIGSFILFPSWKRISVCNFSIFSWISIYFYFSHLHDLLLYSLTLHHLDPFYIYIYIYKLNKSVQNHEIIIIRLNCIKIIFLKIFIFFKIHWKIGVKLSFANCCWCCLVVFAFGLSYVFVIIS